MKTLILASNNKGKLEEIRAILKDRFEVLSLSDCKISADIEETGATFEENALIKANKAGAAATQFKGAIKL